jgi:hypothetical protein
MGTSLTGLTPATTYDALIKVGDNGPLDGTLKTLSDGLGNDLPLKISTTLIQVDSTLLCFNGTTSSFPAIKRNGTAINFTLADDSALCPVNTGNINVTGFVLISSNLEFGATSYMGFANRSLFRSPSDGVLTLLNYDSNNFSRLQFGGTTSSFPSIKRNGTAIDFRLADDTDFCPVNTGVLSIQNTVATAVSVASTHKVTVVIGGTTYYLLASNV